MTQNSECGCGASGGPCPTSGGTREDTKRILDDLLPHLPREECRTCDCFQGFLTQLDIDATDAIENLVGPLRASREDMHGCLGCDPCPPGAAFTEYLKKHR